MVYFLHYSATDPALRWCTIGLFWKLLEPITVSFVSERGHRLSFTVPAGFETDLASIPRLLRSIIPQVGGQNLPAIVHDWCYREKSMSWLSKADADLLFRMGMEQAGVGRTKRTVLYTGVKWFGRWSYQPK